MRYIKHAVTVTDRSSSCNIIFLSFTPCDVFQRGLLTSAAYAPINHAVLMLNSTLFRHLHAHISQRTIHTEHVVYSEQAYIYDTSSIDNRQR